MSNEDRTITRRHALRTGTLFLGAGLLGNATTAAATAEPIAIPSTLAAVVNYHDLTADCERLVAQLRGEEDAYWAAADVLRATLSPEQVKLYTAFSDAQSDRAATYHEWVNAETARHLPAFSGVIRLLWFHIIAEPTSALSSCCTPDAGYEP